MSACPSDHGCDKIVNTLSLIHTRECALIANVNGYLSIRSVIHHSRTTENKS